MFEEVKAQVTIENLISYLEKQNPARHFPQGSPATCPVASLLTEQLGVDNATVGTCSFHVYNEDNVQSDSLYLPEDIRLFILKHDHFEGDVSALDDLQIAREIKGV